VGVITDDMSIFVFNSQLALPVFVHHVNSSNSNLNHNVDPQYIAYATISQFIYNYINNYSLIHPTLTQLTPSILNDCFCSFIFTFLNEDVIYTNNISLNTFVRFEHSPINGYWGSNFEDLFTTIASLNNTYYELNGNTSNPVILAKIASLKNKATTANFHVNNPNFDITSYNN